MIQLFAPLDVAITIPLDEHVLHGKQVREFEQEFADYVGAKYACSFNSASSAIFLIFTMIKQLLPADIKVISLPSMIPPVVPNAVLNAGWPIILNNQNRWIGSKYRLYQGRQIEVWDSAQDVQPDSYKQCAYDNLIIFSFYPTKPVPSIDGGMVVSNNKEIIEYLRILSLNGTENANNSWERKLIMPGWKMYMNTAQAIVATQSLRKLPKKLTTLDSIRNAYVEELSPHVPITTADSYHLFRIDVQNPDAFIQIAKKNGIICGIHYHDLARHPLYMQYANHNTTAINLTASKIKEIPVSIPFHANLTAKDVAEVVSFVKDWVLDADRSNNLHPNP